MTNEDCVIVYSHSFLASFPTTWTRVKGIDNLSWEWNMPCDQEAEDPDEMGVKKGRCGQECYAFHPILRLSSDLQPSSSSPGLVISYPWYPVANCDAIQFRKNPDTFKRMILLPKKWRLFWKREDCRWFFKSIMQTVTQQDLLLQKEVYKISYQALHENYTCPSVFVSLALLLPFFFPVLMTKNTEIKSKRPVMWVLLTHSLHASLSLFILHPPHEQKHYHSSPKNSSWTPTFLTEWGKDSRKRRSEKKEGRKEMRGGRPLHDITQVDQLTSEKTKGSFASHYFFILFFLRYVLLIAFYPFLTYLCIRIIIVQDIYSHKLLYQ